MAREDIARAGGRAQPNATGEALDRLARSKLTTAREVSQSLRQLGAVDEGRHDLAATRGRGNAANATLIALKAAGQDLSISDRTIEGHAIDEVPAVCRALGTTARHVVLPPGWWQSDQGHLVGLLRSDDSESDATKTGTVVALLARPLGGYLMCEPDSGARVRVSDDLARQIAPMAYAVYPALPPKVAGLVDLARFLWPALRPDLWRVVLASAVIGLLGLLIPIATGIIIDELIPGRELDLLVQVGLGLLLAAAVASAFSITQNLALLRLGGRSTVLLQGAIWNRLLRLPATFFKHYSSGDLAQRVSGIESMRAAVLSVILSASITSFFSLFYLGLLFSYDTRLALIAILIVGVLAAVTFVAGLTQLKYHKRQAIVSGWLSGFVFQVLQGIVKLRVAGAEDRAFARWASRYADERAAIMATRRISNHYSAFADAYGIIALALLYSAVGYLGGLGLSAGTFIAFLAAFGAFQAAFMGLSSAALEVVAVMPDYERAKPVLEATPEQSDKAADPGPLSGAITLSHVTFAYDAGATPVLKDVSLEITPGAHVAVVGPSGSGKSTLLRILLGLERPQSGTVLYDGQDLQSLDLQRVRRQIGVVLQTGRVFAGTILENIRGATNASLEDCLAACEAAGFAGDLATFPMGLHTPLTEGAATISGGQRQRLLIARALVGRPRMLFMDEATSALDNRTQAVVTESLDRLSVTRLVIAHRLSTVRNADIIVVMDKGTIVEQGDFDELIAAGGLFADLAKRQLT